LEKSRNPFQVVKDHVLLPFANSFLEEDKKMTLRITKNLIENTVNLIPDSWLTGDPVFSSIIQNKDAYIKYFLKRLENRRFFTEEAIRARSLYL
jgi:hypothetical protein